MDRINGGPGQAQPARETHVSSQFGRLVEAGRILEDTIGLLEQRLSLVLRPEGPSNPTTPNKTLEGKQLVPFADALSAFAEGVEKANQKLGGLIDRIEL